MFLLMVIDGERTRLPRSDPQSESDHRKILAELRAGTKPFTDKGENGTLYTVNTNGDWKKCLLFNEILEAMDPNDTDRAWAKLRKVKLCSFV